ncbi:MAG TPA: hypothetical protein VJ892_01405 [Candidatus Absconditabacterales bacterium]|nr:hypothetical protein [Candidatus Absconditabacterales bacterium]
MKKLFLLLSLFTIALLTGCSQISNITTPKTYNNTDQNILNFLEQTIEEQESCNQKSNNEKTFVSFAVLGTGKAEFGDLIYYLLINGEGIYIDERGNLSSSCGFSGIPASIELKKTNTGYIMISYSVNSTKDESTLKRMFSSSAYNKLKQENHIYNTNISPLQRAEKYFGITFWTGGNFECTFCDQNRYYAGNGDEEKVKKGIQKSYSIFTNNKNEENRYLTFNSNGNFENHNSRDEGTGIRIFGQDNTTILVDAYPSHTYDRYIIQYQTGDEIHLTREILQK